MKKIILLSLFLNLLISSFGQKNSVTFGKNLKIRDFIFTKEVMSFDNDKFIVFSEMFNYKGYHFFKFDKNFNVIKKSLVPHKIRNKRFNMKKVCIIENQIFAFFTIENINKNEDNLFAVKINPNTLKFEDEIVHIGSHNLRKWNQAGGGFDFVQSENKNYVGVLIRQPFDISNNYKNKYGQNFQPANDEISFVVLDKNLKEINAVKNGLIASKKGQNMTPYKHIVDNKGNFYILATEDKFTQLQHTKQHTIKHKSIEDVFENGILAIKKFGVDKKQNTYLYEGNKVFIDLNLVMDNAHNNLFLIGLVGEMARSWIGSIGIEKIEIDPDEMEKEDIVYQGFSRLLMDGILQKSITNLPNKTDLSQPHDKNIDDWKTSLTLLRSLNFVTVDTNGSIYIALESFSVDVRRDGNLVFKTYFYGPVVMMKFDVKSKQVYQNFVVKTNQIHDKELTSVTGFVNDGKFIVNAQNSVFILDENFLIIECLYLTDYVENITIRKKHHLWIINFVLDDQKSIVSFFVNIIKFQTLRVEI